MKHLLIIFHSQSGRNQRLALSALQAGLARIQSEELELSIQLQAALEINVQSLCRADALLIIGAETFAQINGGLKLALDNVYYPALALQQSPAENRVMMQGIPYQLVIASGNDGSFCDKQLRRILQGLSAKPVGETLFIHGEPQETDLSAVSELTETLLEALAMGLI